MATSQDYRARAAKRALKRYENEKLRRELDKVSPTAIKQLAAAAVGAVVPEQICILLLYQRKRGYVPGGVVDFLEEDLGSIQKGGSDDPMPEIRDYLAQLVRLHKTDQVSRKGGRR